MPLSATTDDRKPKATTGRVLGEQIRIARAKVGLTQRGLAIRLGITPGAVAQWETGHASPSRENLVLLSAALNVPLTALLSDAVATAQPEQTPPHETEEQQLLAEARRLGVDLRQVVAEARRRFWLEENRAALDDANLFLERYGLWSDGRRQF